MKKGTKTMITMAVLICILGGAAAAYPKLKQQAAPQRQLIVESIGETVAASIESDRNEERESAQSGTLEESQDGGAGQDSNTTRDSSAGQEKTAPDFSVTDAQGNTVKLSDLAGKPVVLNFWASWCPPCKGEMPEFDGVYQELGDEVQFMMIDLTDGYRETVETATEYVEEQGYAFPIFFDTQYEAAYQYHVQSIPQTYFIDRDGNLVARAPGAIDEETLRRGIDMIRRD